MKNARKKRWHKRYSGVTAERRYRGPKRDEAKRPLRPKIRDGRGQVRSCTSVDEGLDMAASWFGNRQKKEYRDDQARNACRKECVAPAEVLFDPAAAE